MLISALYQSIHEASASCDEHEAIVETIAAGARARPPPPKVWPRGAVEAGLNNCGEADALSDLRHALRPRARGGW